MLSLDEINRELRQLAKSKKKGSGQAKEILNTTVKKMIVEEIGIEIKCPKCGSTRYVKAGKGRLKCKDCNSRFRPSANTITRGYNFSKQEWINIIENVIDNDDLHLFNKMGIKKNQAHQLRIKILSAIANVPQPMLTGIVQVDGTYFRESQKGKKELTSFVSIVNERPSRHDKIYHPTVCGIFGKEVICCLTGIDNRGFVFADCVSLGQPTYQEVKDCLNKHIDNPSYICTDDYKKYDKYCKEYKIQHHITPSNYDELLNQRGYVKQSEKYHSKPLSEEEIQKNERIIKQLYSEGEGVCIKNSGKMSYETYQEIINSQGKYNFGLYRINQFHGMLKQDLVNGAKNVSSKYLKLYVALEVYKHNFKVKYGHYLGDENNDYEIVLSDVLAYYDYSQYKEIMNAEFLFKPVYNVKKDKQAKEHLDGMRNNFADEESALHFNGKDVDENYSQLRKFYRSLDTKQTNTLCNEFNIDRRHKHLTQKQDLLSMLPNAREIMNREAYKMYCTNGNNTVVEKKSKKKNIFKVYTKQEVKDIKSKRKIFLDAETTGINAWFGDEILSLTLIDELGNVLYDNLIRPTKHNKWKPAEKVNHITPEMVRNSPTIKEEIFTINNILKDYDMVVGFNTDFDLDFLKLNGANIEGKLSFDVMKTYQQIFELKKYPKLDKVANYYNFDWNEYNRHSSLGDTMATLHCFKAMLNLW